MIGFYYSTNKSTRLLFRVQVKYRLYWHGRGIMSLKIHLHPFVMQIIMYVIFKNILN